MTDAPTPERVAWLSPGPSAALAGLLAFIVSLAAELPLGNGMIAQGQPGPEAVAVLALFVAPWLEELAKRLCMWPLGARWGATGLAFGVAEAVTKIPLEFDLVPINGAIISVLLHWGLGRAAERLRFGLLWAILLHAAFNWISIVGTSRLGSGFSVAATALAALLLALTFRWPRRA